MKPEMQFELLQPWSTFVMKTQLPPEILQKMLKITDEIIENRVPRKKVDVEAGQIEDMFLVEFETLEREELVGFFLDMCGNFIVQAFCQSAPFNKEMHLKEEWMIRLNSMWINSQKDNEYFPIHYHSGCTISAIMYLKIPEFLPSRKSQYNRNDDGAIIFTGNVSKDPIWGNAVITYQPQVGDFFIFPASQQHCVYPFRTADGKGERRSVSFNAVFKSKTEQDALKKQQEEQEAI